MRPEYQIGMLWMEGALSFLEQLCVKSFVDAGHHVVLYHYGPLSNVPDGVEQRDAAEVLPKDGFLTHERTGSPALHSDLFRYRMLERSDRMIWADTDAYCVKPFETATGHFYGWESKRHVNGGVLGLPKDSETLGRLLEFTRDEFAIPPWASDDLKAEYEAAAARGAPVHAGEMRWGVWGPHAVTHFLKETGEIRHALPRVALYPFSFKDRRKMLRKDTEMTDYVTDETYSIHLYGRRMRKRIVEAENGVPRRWSPLGRLLKRHGIDPLAAPIPGTKPRAPKEAPKPIAAPSVKPSAALNDQKIVVLSTMKNEGAFILDWIGYNRFIGVDHFLVYTNDCDDTTVEILQRLQEMGIATHVENPFDRAAQERPQRAALADAAKQPVLRNADWVLPIDVDEYADIHVGDGGLRGLIADCDTPDMIAMTWRFFGCGGVVDYQDRHVAEQFQRAAPEFTRKPHHNWGFKTLFSSRAPVGKLGVHRPLGIGEGPMRWVNGSGAEMPERYRSGGWRSAADCWGYEKVTLNHYATRSVDSFLVKRDRGRVNHVNRDQGMEYWSIFNRNDQFTASIQPRVEAARPFVEELKADAELAKLHQASVDWHRAKIDELKGRPEFLELHGELAQNPLTHKVQITAADGETPRFERPPEEIIARTFGAQEAPADAVAAPSKAEDGPTTKPSDAPVTVENHPILTGAEAEEGYQQLIKRNREQFEPLPAPTVALSHDKIAIVTSMKNEGPYILEWIAYHQAIGVGDFLVYTNDCEDGTDEILDRLAEMGMLTHLANPFKRDKGQKPQRGALNDAADQPVVKGADWVLISDVDEFVNIHVGDGRMQDLIRASNGPNLISLTWRFFGNGGVDEFRDEFVTEQFTRAAPRFIPKPRLGWGFKTMVHSSAPYGKLGVHRPLQLDEDRKDQARWVNGGGLQMPEFAIDGNTWRSTKRSIGYELATLNHYVLRSAESFLIKRERGRINHVDEDQGLEYWARRNYCTEEETSILARLDPMKERFAALKADPVLGALHDDAVAWHKRRIEALKAKPDFMALYEKITAPDQMDAVYYQKDATLDDEE